MIPLAISALQIPYCLDSVSMRLHTIKHTYAFSALLFDIAHLTTHRYYDVQVVIALAVGNTVLELHSCVLFNSSHQVNDHLLLFTSITLFLFLA